MAAARGKQGQLDAGNEFPTDRQKRDRPRDERRAAEPDPIQDPVSRERTTSCLLDFG